ncbi:MAG: amidohydrolase family protein [Candidatus Cybelea sp.]
MTRDCRCPHRPYSNAIFRDAEYALGRRAFLAGAAAAGISMLLPWRARAAGVTVLKAARLFNGESMQTPGLLVISGDRIVSLREGDAGSGAAVLELGDATIMPGLIDCHTHVSAFIMPSYYMTLTRPKYSTADNVPEATIYSVRNAQALLRNGFTTVRDVRRSRSPAATAIRTTFQAGSKRIPAFASALSRTVPTAFASLCAST